MRKIILLIAMLLMAAPVMAEPVVTITCTDDDVNCVTVSYAVTDSNNLVRAFGLNIQFDSDDVNIVKVVVPEDPNYRIYPGQISIENGEVNDYKTPYDPCELGEPNLAIEMGSLYTFDSNYEDDPNAGYGKQPSQAGVLLKFYIEDGDLGCYDVTEDEVTGGVVMEDPCEDANVIIVDGCFEATECFPDDDPNYDDWVAVGKPDCWCYPRQCHGDADGLAQGSALAGYWYVTTDDLDIMSLGWLKKEPPKGSGILNLQVGGVPVACADFARNKEGSALAGYWYIGTTDLDLMSLYWLKKEPGKGSGTPTDCVPGNCEPGSPCP